MPVDCKECLFHVDGTCYHNRLKPQSVEYERKYTDSDFCGPKGRFFVFMKHHRAKFRGTESEDHPIWVALAYIMAICLPIYLVYIYWSTFK